MEEGATFRSVASSPKARIAEPNASSRRARPLNTKGAWVWTASTRPSGSVSQFQNRGARPAAAQADKERTTLSFSPLHTSAWSSLRAPAEDAFRATAHLAVLFRSGRWSSASPRCAKTSLKHASKDARSVGSNDRAKEAVRRRDFFRSGESVARFLLPLPDESESKESPTLVGEPLRMSSSRRTSRAR